MTRTQSFILILALLIAAVVLYALGLETPGALALGAVIGALAPTKLTGEGGGTA